MARSATTAQANALASATRMEFARILVQNPDGVMTDTTALASRNWFSSADLDFDIDQPLAQATIRFRRDHGSLSLSPLRTDSTLNRNAALAYAPFLDVSRAVYVEVAVLDPAVATSPAAGDWQRIFQGTFDDVDPAEDEVVCQARDLGARLADSWLEEPTAVVIEGGSTMSMEQVVQRLLDDALGAGVITLFTPVSPSYTVTRFGYQREPVLDAIQRLVQSIGWDCRYLWDSGTSSFRLTLYNPPRAKTTPDLTLAPSQYRSIKRLKISRATVRNKVKVYFTNGPLRDYIVVEDNPSQLRYGVRPIIIEEAGDSTINSPAEATTMANALIADLKDPRMDQEADAKFDWRVEINDLLRFSPNAVHYNTNQDLAALGIRHSLASVGPSRTVLTGRGSPSGAYRSWIKRGAAFIGNERSVQPPALGNIRRVDTDTDSTIFFTLLGAVVEVWAAYAIVPAPEASTDWENVAASVMPLPIGTTSFVVPRPLDGQVVLVQLEPRARDLTPGTVRRIAITATPQPPTEDRDFIEATPTSTAWFQPSPRGIPVVLIEAWSQSGNSPASGWGPPSRQAGDASLVKTGVLGALDVEHDVTLDASRPSVVRFRCTLANGQVIEAAPFVFDRDKNPNIVSVIKNGTVLTITCDVDTKSIKVKDKNGTWVKMIDGVFGVFDVSTVDPNGVAGLGTTATGQYTVTAYAEPTVSVDGSTAKAEQDIVVTGATAPAASALWDTVTITAPGVGSSAVVLHLKATAAPVGWNVKVYLDEGTTSAVVPTTDRTASLTPALSAPPASLTDYSYTSSFPNTGFASRYVTLRARIDLRDATNVVIDSRTIQTNWYTP